MRRRRTPKKRKPPFAIAAAVVGIAAAGYGAYASSKNKPQGESQGQTKQVYPQETIDLFRGIESPLLKSTQQEQYATLAPMWGPSSEAAGLAQQYGAPIQKAVGSALMGGARQAGISDTGQAQLDIQGLPPVLVNALKQLALQNAAQRTSVVPAGYGNFLAPGQASSQTTSQSSDPVSTGFALAGSVANLGAQVQKQY